MADEAKITAAANSAEGNNVAENTPEKTEQAEKTFTQSQVDEIIKQRLERERKNSPDKEQMKAFKAWQDSQKTAEQLSAEKVTAAETAKAETEKQLAAAQAKIAAYSKGVKSEAVDDVIALAMAKVTDDVTIEKAIDLILEKYPSFGSAQEKPKGITTGVSFGNAGTAAVSGVEAAFLAKNPGLKF